MGAKVFYQQDDPDTARHISETLGYRSGYSHSETLRDGEVASQGRSETAVHVFTQREAMEQDLDDVIFFFKNLKPGRGKRVEPWRYPLLEKRRRMPAPPVNKLPPVPDIVFPSGTANDKASAWRRDSGLRFPIDSDDFN